MAKLAAITSIATALLSGIAIADAHNHAMDRMVQAGAVPVTWQQVLLEWQRVIHADELDQQLLQAFHVRDRPSGIC